VKMAVFVLALAGVVYMSKPVLARGYRNNNPGNIKRTDDKWEGLRPVQVDPVFFQFVSPEYGIRALTKIIIRYINDYDRRTINQIISRYAPGSENDTQAYIDFVAEYVGIPAYSVLDWFELPKLVEAIILFENGYRLYSADTLQRGFSMAAA